MAVGLLIPQKFAQPFLVLENGQLQRLGRHAGVILVQSWIKIRHVVQQRRVRKIFKDTVGASFRVDVLSRILVEKLRTTMSV